MAQTVIGMFDNASEAQQAVEQLVNNGFDRNDIDVSSQSSSDNLTSTTERHHEEEDGITRFFSNLFGGNDEAKTYSNVARRSGSVVTVHARSSEEASQAAEILDDAGAVDVNERAAQFGYNTSSSSLNATSNYSNTDDASYSNTGDTSSIKVIEEELQVGKRVVETGGARIRSRIVEKPVEESLRLRQEYVRVERTPVNRPASEADLAAFQQGSIEMIEHKEVPVVNKQARVVEEISLNKEVDERTETVRDTVRKTEVDVENLSKDSRLDVDSDRLDRDDDTLDSDDFRNRPANL